MGNTPQTSSVARVAGALLSGAAALGLLWGMPLGGIALFAQWRGGNILSASGPEPPQAVAAWAATLALSGLIALASSAAGAAVVLARGPSAERWSALRRFTLLVACGTNLLVGLGMSAMAISGEVHTDALAPAAVWASVSAAITAFAVKRLGVHGPTPVRVATLSMLLLPTAGVIGLIVS